MKSSCSTFGGTIPLVESYRNVGEITPGLEFEDLTVMTYSTTTKTVTHVTTCLVMKITFR
ncbi:MULTISPECIES: hypothetical protein [Butyricimonas]|uniref:Uncharacterized protein n=1 Tax=Butyricimonas paravirosa TaxID=1472417 RepID=A0A7X5YED1_9BACT|nr:MULTISPECIES: hypothetical protein [Odoribacteraceae]NJC19549.1 hypothetical protein [Butyricimonas paravirosa]